jgi:hypothetical protein
MHFTAFDHRAVNNQLAHCARLFLLNRGGEFTTRSRCGVKHEAPKPKTVPKPCGHGCVGL